MRPKVDHYLVVSSIYLIILVLSELPAYDIIMDGKTQVAVAIFKLLISATELRDWKEQKNIQRKIW